MKPEDKYCRGSCIPKSWVNDGRVDCVNGRDEGAEGMKKNFNFRLQLGLDLLPKFFYTSKKLYWYSYCLIKHGVNFFIFHIYKIQVVTVQCTVYILVYRGSPHFVISEFVIFSISLILEELYYVPYRAGFVCADL